MVHNKNRKKTKPVSRTGKPTVAKEKELSGKSLDLERYPGNMLLTTLQGQIKEHEIRLKHVFELCCLLLEQMPGACILVTPQQFLTLPKTREGWEIKETQLLDGSGWEIRLEKPKS